MAEHDTPIGYIVGESSPQTFSFVTSPDLMPGRLEYLAIRAVTERIDGQIHEIDVLAQVTALGVGSAILGSDLTYEETVAILQGQYSDRPRVIGEARVIGYLKEDEGGHKSVRRPRFAAAPGHSVYIAGDTFLQEFFTTGIEHGIEVGHLINRSGVRVQLDPNGLRRHLAIIAQTGAGKSYLAGKLLESLVELGATVLVLDPNSDYVQIRKVTEDANMPYQSARRTPFADRVDLYRVPGVEHHRFSEDLVGPSQPFTVRFADLTTDEIFDLAGIRESFTRIREAVQQALEALQDDSVDYTPVELNQRLTEMADSEDNDRQTRDAARGASRYIEPLSRYRIWGEVDFNLDAMLQPQKVTVIDLAGGGQRVVAYVADKALREIWRRALVGQLEHPVFVLLEEAHTLVPGGRFTTRASSIINNIASEGRKFRVFLILVTQRPSKIDEEALSQCGSQIIMQVTNPRDQNSIENAAEALSKELMADLPGLNRGEAIVIGQLMRVPAMIAVSGRASAEGGADIDLVRELERARQSAEVAQVREENAPASAAPRGRESML
jgi:DNA helicase HerA-like ATPase